MNTQHKKRKSNRGQVRVQNLICILQYKSDDLIPSAAIANSAYSSSSRKFKWSFMKGLMRKRCTLRYKNKISIIPINILYRGTSRCESTRNWKPLLPRNRHNWPQTNVTAWKVRWFPAPSVDRSPGGWELRKAPSTDRNASSSIRYSLWLVGAFAKRIWSFQQ